MRLILPRRLTNARTDHALFSGRFRPEVAGLISSLAVLLTRPAQQGQGHTMTIAPMEVIESDTTDMNHPPTVTHVHTKHSTTILHTLTHSLPLFPFTCKLTR